MPKTVTPIYFYPRSPCGERLYHNTIFLRIHQFLSTLSLRRATPIVPAELTTLVFLSTLSLRRATILPPVDTSSVKISIHALLAESDASNRTEQQAQREFLSTLSLRRATIAGRITSNGTKISIHALLAESDRLCRILYSCPGNFYPRSPCGERRTISRLYSDSVYFYPRSPCGERRLRRDRPKEM